MREVVGWSTVAWAREKEDKVNETCVCVLGGGGGWGGGGKV
jgi:hypothetical protein